MKINTAHNNINFKARKITLEPSFLDQVKKTAKQLGVSSQPFTDVFEKAQKSNRYINPKDKYEVTLGFVNPLLDFPAVQIKLTDFFGSEVLKLNDKASDFAQGKDISPNSAKELLDKIYFIEKNSGSFPPDKLDKPIETNAFQESIETFNPNGGGGSNSSGAPSAQWVGSLVPLKH